MFLQLTIAAGEAKKVLNESAFATTATTTTERPTTAATPPTTTRIEPRNFSCNVQSVLVVSKPPWYV